MQRYDLIQKLIDQRWYKSYLEIWVSNGDTFTKIKCDRKLWVDPVAQVEWVVEKMSDDFFNSNTEMFDIVFIDWLHTFEQSLKDLINASRCLNEWGIIIMHDCLPWNEDMASPVSNGGAWNWDVYKTVIRVYNEWFDIFVIDTDHWLWVFNNKKIREYVFIWAENYTYQNYMLKKDLYIVHIEDWLLRLWLK